MTADELLRRMIACDFIVCVKNNQLVVKQQKWIDDELEQLICKHKDELIRLVNKNE